MLHDSKLFSFNSLSLSQSPSSLHENISIYTHTKRIQSNGLFFLYHIIYKYYNSPFSLNSQWRVFIILLLLFLVCCFYWQFSLYHSLLLLLFSNGVAGYPTQVPDGHPMMIPLSFTPRVGQNPYVYRIHPLLAVKIFLARVVCLRFHTSKIGSLTSGHLPGRILSLRLVFIVYIFLCVFLKFAPLVLGGVFDLVVGYALISFVNVCYVHKMYVCEESQIWCRNSVICQHDSFC